MAEEVSLSAISVSVSVVDIAADNVTERVADRIWGKRACNSVRQIGECLSDELWTGLAPSEGGLGAHGLCTTPRLDCSCVDVDRESGQLCPGALTE